MIEKRLYRAAFAVYALLLFWAIMFKCNMLIGDLFFGFRSITLIPFYTIIRNAISDGEIGFGFFVETIGNIAVFVPLGVLLPLGGRKMDFGRVTLISAGVSIFFEVLQYTIAFGSSDITDVIMNTAGGMLGFALWRLFGSKLKPKYINIILAVLTALGAIIFVSGAVDTAIRFDKYFI